MRFQLYSLTELQEMIAIRTINMDEIDRQCAEVQGEELEHVLSELYLEEIAFRSMLINMFNSEVERN